MYCVIGNLMRAGIQSCNKTYCPSLSYPRYVCSNREPLESPSVWTRHFMQLLLFKCHSPATKYIPFYLSKDYTYIKSDLEANPVIGFFPTISPSINAEVQNDSLNLI